MSTAQKIVPLAELASVLADIRTEGKRIVQCHGVFDLLHPGHIRHFEAARRHGDILVVTVTPDRFVSKGPGRPVFNQRLRAESIAALACVDYVAVNDEPTAVASIKLLSPHVYAKGKDYQDRDSDLTRAIRLEEQAIHDVGGHMVFTSEVTFSSTELLNQFYGVYSEDAGRFLEDFKVRYSAGSLIGRLRQLEGLRVLVIGEAILDEYHYCHPMGKSPKEAIVSTRYIRDESFAGGALACANHVAGFCRDVHLVTCLGAENPREDFVRAHLKSNITAQFVYRPGAPTIVKRRFIWETFLTKMFEVSFLDDTELSSDLEDELLGHLDGVMGQYDLVIVIDYGHGFLSGRAAAFLGEKARFLAVNTQANSANLGFNLITKYPRVDYACIDEPEIRLAMHDRSSPVLHIAEKVKGLLGAPAICVTRGHLGCLAVGEHGGPCEVPVFSSDIVDRVGAGDAFLSVTAPCVAGGMPMDAVGFIGNAVGALAVRIVGNRTSVEPVQLFKFLTALLK
jgi:rfaE bifunctional protein nucleotidyltransferase chain/domain